MLIYILFFLFILGITQHQYRTSVDNGIEIDWKCIRYKSTPTPLQSFSEFIPYGSSTHLLPDLTAELSALSSLSHTESDMDTYSFSIDYSTANFPANNTLAAEIEAFADAYAADCSDTSMPPFNVSSPSDSFMDSIDLLSFHVPEYPTEESINDSLPIRATAADT